VILTLVLLGQLLEAKAHSRTSGAIKECEISAHGGYLRSLKEAIKISVHDIKKRFAKSEAR
jgi:Cu2+-exporting ATPase